MFYRQVVYGSHLSLKEQQSYLWMTHIQVILHAVSTAKRSHRRCPVLLARSHSCPQQPCADLLSFLWEWIDFIQVHPVSLWVDRWDGNSWSGWVRGHPKATWSSCWTRNHLGWRGRTGLVGAKVVQCSSADHHPVAFSAKPDLFATCQSCKLALLLHPSGCCMFSHPSGRCWS